LYPIGKVDCEAFIDQTIEGYYPVFSADAPDYPTLDYAADVINHCGDENLRSQSEGIQFTDLGGIRQAQESGNYNLDSAERNNPKVWKRVSDAGSAPFRSISWSVGPQELIFHDGKYYEAISGESWKHTPTGSTDAFWTLVTTPDETWDTVPEYGGRGYLLDPETSPKVYTLSFSGILGAGEEPLPGFDGVYHLWKHYAWEGTDANGGADFSGGIYKLYAVGWNGEKSILEITFWLKLSNWGQQFGNRIENQTRIYARIFNSTVWDEAVTYSTDDRVTHSSAYYVSRQDNNLNHTPAGFTDSWWTYSAVPLSDSIYEKTFDSEVENNYGAVRKRNDVDNENETDETLGFEGIVSFYPGKHKAWAARTTYQAEDVVVFEGSFWRANEANKNSSPGTSGSWDEIT